MLLSVVSKCLSCTYNSCATILFLFKINTLRLFLRGFIFARHKMVRLKKQQAQKWGVNVSWITKIIINCLLIVQLQNDSLFSAHKSAFLYTLA